VLELVSRGLSNDEIGACLSISTQAVKLHVAALMRRFDVPGRAGLYRAALEAHEWPAAPKRTALKPSDLVTEEATLPASGGSS
jgi:hypothetical protein